MSRVTSKLQVTIPRRIADRFGIRPGDDIDWVAAGEGLRVLTGSDRSVPADPGRRVALFDQATERQAARRTHGRARERGWSREDLYARGDAG